MFTRMASSFLSKTSPASLWNIYKWASWIKNFLYRNSNEDQTRDSRPTPLVMDPYHLLLKTFFQTKQAYLSKKILIWDIFVLWLSSNLYNSFVYHFDNIIIVEKMEIWSKWFCEFSLWYRTLSYGKNKIESCVKCWKLKNINK